MRGNELKLIKNQKNTYSTAEVCTENQPWELANANLNDALLVLDTSNYDPEPVLPRTDPLPSANQQKSFQLNQA